MRHFSVAITSFTIILSSLMFSLSAQVNQPVWCNDALSEDEKVEAILSQLTLEEKVKLCAAQGKFTTPGVPRLGIPELWYSDGPHGVRAEINWNDWGYAKWRNDSVTAFPALTCLAASFDPDLAYLYGQSLGAEARYRKKDVILGPGVNIYRMPLNGRNFEYMGEDPYLASVMVQPYIRGVQENGVATCVKHYALNNQEIDRGHINVEVSERALREIYLPAFKAAADAGAWTFMGAYNQYKNQHCCHNEYLNKILKEEWAWDGAFITDWGGCHDTEQAVKNGLDLEMGTYTNGLTSESKFDYNHYYLADAFLQGLRDGKYSQEQLDDKARRIIRLMLRTNLNSQRPWGSLATEAHAKAAQKIAEGGMVLLQNKDNMLPIVEAPKRIAVIGENAIRNLMQGGGSSELKPKRVITPLQGIKERFPEAEIVFARAYDSGKAMYSNEGKPTHNLDSLHAEAVRAAAQSDIVIFVGGLNKNHKQDCEAADRYSYELPFNQPKLINDIAAVNENVVVVLMSGNAVETSWAPKVKAIVQAWYAGSEAGYAIASVLSGDVNPSGKLPFSFPKKLSDNGAISYGQLSYPGDGVKQVYMEDILVGYRWHDTKKIPAAYPFGYGLSYTTFNLSNARCDANTYPSDGKIQLSIDIENTGSRDGAEVIQVYVSDVKSSVVRPYQELKAFQKVFLKAGEKQTVSLTIPVSSFAFWDETSSSWNTEAGDYMLRVGNSSRQISANIRVKVKAE
ncbi:MAG: glycoside hydrolase family 3 C-terminal domain-containing protein [Bacteroidales bacterium]|nr:glycoside hydrolase family 3 C-terminal domain-containing protein [Bacteroidales bacterium]